MSCQRKYTQTHTLSLSLSLWEVPNQSLHFYNIALIVILHSFYSWFKKSDSCTLKFHKWFPIHYYFAKYDQCNSIRTDVYKET